MRQVFLLAILMMGLSASVRSQSRDARTRPEPDAVKELRELENQLSEGGES